MAQTLKEGEKTYFITTDGQLGVLDNKKVKLLYESDYTLRNLARVSPSSLAIGTREGRILLYDEVNGSLSSDQELDDLGISNILQLDSALAIGTFSGEIKFMTIDGDISSVAKLSVPIVHMTASPEAIWIVSGTNKLTAVNTAK